MPAPVAFPGFQPGTPLGRPVEVQAVARARTALLVALPLVIIDGAVVAMAGAVAAAPGRDHGNCRPAAAGSYPYSDTSGRPVS